ncbi:BACON domain-containing protein [Parabacteroides gordonii]|uniref:BACON domain-containing protein n=1 Tax=Parabacteroides gordonii TaxID=574930 RepID=UPI0026EA5E1E|nr:BACON domain-containing carbohydrate-binding protein [Parabacteroides gordonii]
MKQAITTKQSPHRVRSIFSPLERGQGVCKCPPINQLFLLLLLLLASCTEADVANDLRPVAGQEVEASFNLQVLANQTTKTRSITFTAEGAIESDSLAVTTNDSIKTKSTASLTSGQESQLSSLWVGQYDGTGTRLFSQYFSTLSGNTVDIKLKVNTAGQTSRVYFVANTTDLGAVADEATLKARTLPYGSTEAGLPDNNSLCMMMGQWNGAIPSGGLNNITVNLTRLIAKISFTYAIGGSGFSFTPASVTLKNAPALSQVSAPTTQLAGADMSYKNYTDKNPAPASKTFYWYLPENMAGTVTGSDAVGSEKQKVGTGVTNATCIELRGNAVQDGVSYSNVVIRFFPGKSMNNYDIVRNAHYQMNVTLVGLDVSDDRITVGEIPPVEVAPGNMAAAKESEKTVQIPARPGISWVLDLPPWLSALVEGKPAPAGSTITYEGPVVVTLQAATANPKAEDRTEEISLSIAGSPRNFQLTQTGSELKSHNNIALDVAGVVESPATFTATKGLPWTAVPSAEWIVLTANPTSGEATGEPQTLKVKASGANPSAMPREGRIALKAGESITNAAYTGLKKEIAVAQVGSEVTDCSTSNNTAESVSGVSGSFTATAGLDWRTSVGDDTWIQVTGNESGTPTTGDPQTITFNVDLNPNPTPRSGKITVRAGNPSYGPKNDIIVNQQGSTFELVSPSAVTLEYSATTFNVTIMGTKGLPWEVNPYDAAKQIAPTGHTGVIQATGQNQNIEFQALENTGPLRSETFNITVPGSNHTKTVTVTQKANPIVTIDDSTLKGYYVRMKGSSASYNWTTHPPFDADGVNTAASHGLTGVVLSEAPVMTGYYQIQVESTQWLEYKNYVTMQTHCNDLDVDGHLDWRLPTQIELYAMWDKSKGTDPQGSAGDGEADSKIFGASFLASYYWSSSVSSSSIGLRCGLDFGSGSFSSGYTTSNGYVRCVRDKN